MAMDADEAWRIGNERRREAQRILKRCGIQAYALCALKMRSQEPEPVGASNVVEIVAPRQAVSDEVPVIVIFDEEGNPKACSTGFETVAAAQELALAVRREAGCAQREEVDVYGALDT